MNNIDERFIQDEGLSPDTGYVIKLAKESNYFGRMNDPTSSACLKGVCGDEMEVYLVIQGRIIEDIKFYTKGCISTMICGHLVCELALGKSIEEALGISARDVIEKLYGLQNEHCHCSILAVSALYRAIAEYMLKK